ncbi:MAG: class I SAM-dependent methyltransferase [Bacteroidales bacterium]|jgi:SAM-dependent methyltransferase
MNNPVWEDNYNRGRFNQYPFDRVVSFILSTYGNMDRKQVRILDLGCGGGNNTVFLAKEGFDVYAVDGSTKSIELTRSFTKGLCDPNKIIQADFTHLPFQDGYFQCVLDRQSLGHNGSESLDQIISEINRVLLPGKGLYFGMVFSSNHPHRSYGHFVHPENYNDMFEFSHGIYKKSGLVHFFTVKEIFERFKAFTVMDVITITTRSLFGMADSSDNGESFIIKAQRCE